MRKIGIWVLVIFGGIVVLPTFITILFGPGQSVNSEITKVEKQQKKKEDLAEIKEIKILDTKENKIKKVDFEDYVKHVVAAEMPAAFHEEALKAQAIAARTYALKRMQEENQTLKGADISTDFHTGQAYLSTEELKKRWGNNFSKYYNKISSAVEETRGEIMIYKEEPIEAVFHSTSAGITQSAGDVWQVDVPYLKSVDSMEDEKAPDFISEKTIVKEEFVKQLKNIYPDLVLKSQLLMNQIQIIDRNEAGYVRKIQIGNKLLTGREVRTLFELRSSHFTIREENDKIIFVTKGYGHGAGMSQYGANFMAEQGKSYKEILTHYYNGIQISKMDEKSE